jgi:hypothetical protein
MIKSEVKSLDAFLDSKPRGLGPEEKKITTSNYFAEYLTSIHAGYHMKSLKMRGRHYFLLLEKDVWAPQSTEHSLGSEAIQGAVVQP